MNLTPEKIEQGRKLLQRMTAGEWFRTGPLSDEEACRAGGVAAGLVACFDDTIPEDSEVNLLDEFRVQDIDGIAWLRNNAQALLAAAELGMASRWIPVSERLPEANKIVLAGHDESDDVLPAYADARGHWYSPRDISLGPYPTHWMPLPSPPDQLTGRIGTSTHTP